MVNPKTGGVGHLGLTLLLQRRDRVGRNPSEQQVIAFRSLGTSLRYRMARPGARGGLLFSTAHPLGSVSVHCTSKGPPSLCPAERGSILRLWIQKSSFSSFSVHCVNE